MRHRLRLDATGSSSGAWLFGTSGRGHCARILTGLSGAGSRGWWRRGGTTGEFDSNVDPKSAALAIATLIDALAVEVTLGDDTVSPNYMLGATASVASRLLGADLKLRGTGDDV